MSNYPPIEEARKNLDIQWYRTKIEPEVLRELTKRNNFRGLVQTLGHFGLFIVTGALTFFFWYRRIWTGFAAALWFHGIVSSFLHNVATHELSHRTVFKKKWPNIFFNYLFSLIGWWNPIDYQRSHKYHHMYTFYENADRENVMPLVPVFGFFTLIQLLTVNLFTPKSNSFGSGGFFPTLFFYFRRAFGLPVRTHVPYTEWLHALYEEDPQLDRRSAWWVRFVLIFQAGVIVAGLLTGLWVLPLIITLSPFIAQIFVILVGLPQHSGLQHDNPDFRQVARSMKLGPILSFLYWRMEWHCEHHMYAAVPCYNLRKLARHIAWDMPEPLTLVATWKEMREIWKRQQSDPDYVYEKALPGTAKKAR